MLIFYLTHLAPPRTAAVKVGNSCQEGTLAHRVYVCPKILNLPVDDRRPPVTGKRQPMAMCSPLFGTIGSPRGCSGGVLCIDASNTIQDEQWVRSQVSGPKEIIDPEESIPPLEVGKAVTMVSTSVKLNDNQCEPVIWFNSG